MSAPINSVCHWSFRFVLARRSLPSAPWSSGLCTPEPCAFTTSALRSLRTSLRKAPRPASQLPTKSLSEASCRKSRLQCNRRCSSQPVPPHHDPAATLSTSHTQVHSQHGSTLECYLPADDAEILRHATSLALRRGTATAAHGPRTLCKCGVPSSDAATTLFHRRHKGGKEMLPSQVARASRLVTGMVAWKMGSFRWSSCAIMIAGRCRVTLLPTRFVKPALPPERTVTLKIVS